MNKPLRSGFRRVTKTLLLLLGGGHVPHSPGPTPAPAAYWRSVGRWLWGGASSLRPRVVRPSVGVWPWDGFSRRVARAQRASAGVLPGQGVSALRAVLLRRAQTASLGRVGSPSGRSTLRARSDDEDVALLLAMRASDAKRTGRWRM